MKISKFILIAGLITILGSKPVFIEARVTASPAAAIAAQNARRIREEREREELLDKLERMNSNEREQLLEELERRTEPKREENTIGGEINLPMSKRIAGGISASILAILFAFAIIFILPKLFM